MPHAIYPTRFSFSAIRVCHPGPVAFHCANVLAGNRIETATRGLVDLGRPLGLSISLAAASPKSLGNTSRAGRARFKVLSVHAGLSRLMRSGFCFFRFISHYLTPVSLPQTDDMYRACAGSEHQNVQSRSNESEGLEPKLSVIFAQIFNNQRAYPLVICSTFERNTAFSDVFPVLGLIVADAHLFIVYTIIWMSTTWGITVEPTRRRPDNSAQRQLASRRRVGRLVKCRLHSV